MHRAGRSGGRPSAGVRACSGRRPGGLGGPVRRRFVEGVAATLSAVALGASGGWIALLSAAASVSGIGGILVIVGFMVTAASGLPDGEQGLATGLAP